MVSSLQGGYNRPFNLDKNINIFFKKYVVLLSTSTITYFETAKSNKYLNKIVHRYLFFA
jgi:hypothetical protein